VHVNRLNQSYAFLAAWCSLQVCTKAVVHLRAVFFFEVYLGFTQLLRLISLVLNIWP